VSIVDRTRTIRWLGWSLPIIASALILVDVSSGRAERSSSLMVFAIVTGVLGLGFVMWARSSPSKTAPMLHRTHRPGLTVMSWGAIAACIVALIYLDFSGPQRSWQQKAYSVALPLILIVSDNLVLMSIRYLRTRRQNLARS
jgi:hypothetical protein